MFKHAFLYGRQATKIAVSSRVVHTMAEGLGFNWYSCYDAAVYPAQDDDARWERVFRHAEWLNMRFIRFGQSAGRISDASGAFQPGDVSFDQLRRVDAWASRRGVTLLLDPFAVPAPFRFEPVGRTPAMWGFSMAPRDIEGYVSRFVVPYVTHVVRDMGCQSVRWFNHTNEPFGSGGAYSTPPGVDQHRQYVEVVKAIRQGLDEAGLRGVGQVGPDCHDCRVWPVPDMVAKSADPDPYLDGYDLHSYHSRFDWAPDADNLKGGTDTCSTLMERNLGPAIRYAHERGKPFFLGELGNFYYGWAWGDPAGVARHDNVIGELEFILRAVGLGCDGALRWAWLNPGTADGWWQLIETTGGGEEPLRDPYYGYGTLYRHVDRGASILDCSVVHGPEQDKTVHALAVRNTDWSLALCVINDSYANPVQIEVTMASAGDGDVGKIVIDPVRKYRRCGEFTARLCGGSGKWRDVVSPMSITVYGTNL